MTLRKHSCDYELATRQQATKEIKLDILLSLRHVARVLNVQQSSLSHAMHVTLYINMAHALNKKIPLNAWNRFKRIIQIALNKEYKLQLNPESEQKEKFTSDDMFADDFMNEEQEEWDDNNSETDDPWCTNSIIQVVGVPGLPRNSSVEVEIVAVRSQVLLPSTRWQHFHLAPKSFSDLKMILHSSSWPEKSNTTVNIPYYLSNAADDGLSCEIDAKSFPRCIGTGLINIKSISSAISTTSQVGKEIVRGMFALFGHQFFNMMVNNIRKLTVYYSEHRIKSSDKDLYSLLSKLLQECGIPTNIFPIIILPAARLEDQTIATVQISCLDFHQIETEAWIERGKGFTS